MAEGAGAGSWILALFIRDWMASTSTARSVAASIALVLVGLPLAYTTYTELTRHAIVRKRKRRYHNFLQSRQTSTAKLEGAEAGSSSELAGASEKQLNGEDLAEFQALFASVAVGGRWANPFDEWHEEVGMWNWAGWQLYRVFTGYFLTNNGVPPREELLEVLKVVEPDWDTLFGGGGLDESWEKVPGVDGASTPPLSVKEGKRVEVSDRTNVTWVGQSTCYVQLDSICILTDPILETRTLDSSLAPSRLLPPPLEISQLLSLQIVLISHNHFDHLHPLTILQILQHHPHALYFVPLGLAPFLIDLGVEKENIHEFDWWDSWKGEVEVDAKGGKQTRSVEIVATPAMHWSGRSPLDTNQTLWCSFMLSSPKESLFHCGDTGLIPSLHTQLSSLFPPPTLSLLPIGSYLPQWHLRSVHLSPSDAVVVHQGLKSRHSVAVHHSTWVSLSDEGYLEPREELERVKEVKGVGKGEFVVVEPGRTLVF